MNDWQTDTGQTDQSFYQFNASLMNKRINSFKNDSSTHTVRRVNGAKAVKCWMNDWSWSFSDFSLAPSLSSLSQMKRFSMCSVSFGQFPLLWFSISTVWSVVDLQLWHSEQRRVFEMWDPIGHWHQISANNLQRFTSRRMWQEIQTQCVYEIPKALWAQIFSWS